MIPFDRSADSARHASKQTLARLGLPVAGAFLLVGMLAGDKRHLGRYSVLI